jgi:predicted RNA-binding Zn-ribbon protein involved in translation (DUF1610 family)
MRLTTTLAACLFCFCASVLMAADYEVTRLWTDKLGNQSEATFVGPGTTGEVQLKDAQGNIGKFKLTGFAEPDAKYLRDLIAYKRKIDDEVAATLPLDPKENSLKIQPERELPPGTPVEAEDLPKKPLTIFVTRVWTDNQGKKIQGKLLTYQGDKVALEVNNKPVAVPVKNLVKEDRDYIKIQLTALQRQDLLSDLAMSASAIPDLNGPPGLAGGPNFPRMPVPPPIPPVGNNFNRPAMPAMPAIPRPGRPNEPAPNSPEVIAKNLYEEQKQKLLAARKSRDEAAKAKAEVDRELAKVEQQKQLEQVDLELAKRAAELASRPSYTPRATASVSPSYSSPYNDPTIKSLDEQIRNLQSEKSKIAVETPPKNTSGADLTRWYNSQRQRADDINTQINEFIKQRTQRMSQINQAQSDEFKRTNQAIRKENERKLQQAAQEVAQEQANAEYQANTTRKGCMSCNREVPSHLTAGDKCPHCGVTFDFDETNGKKSTSGGWDFRLTPKGYISLGLLIVGIVGGVIKKLMD